ncbi:MAG: hypothetical protein AAF914_10255 [Pseudomonadota bacterium]
MPIEFATCLEQDLLYARWTGVVTLEEFFENFELYRDDVHYRPGRSELLDATELKDFAVTSNQMRAAVEAINTLGKAAEFRTKSVVLCADDSIFAIGRMYQQLADLAGGVEVSLHTDEASALAALGLRYRSLPDMFAAETFRTAERRSLGVTIP